MKVTGFLLRGAIKRWELRRETMRGLFAGSIHIYGDQEKETPMAISEKIREAEFAIAGIQMIQSGYNLRVKVRVGDEDMSLCEAVKRIGGASRLEKMWKDVVIERDDRYDRTSRNSDLEYAKRAISEKDALDEAMRVSDYAAGLRAAVAVANAAVLEFDVSPNLFE